MAIYRVQISFPADSALPRDEMSINPHFFGDNAQGLADALKANLIAFPKIATAPFKIKVYDAQKAPPNYPLATAEQTGAAPATGVPRELSLCLSYYSTWNRPSYRGRLYLPFIFIGGAVGTRPTLAQRDAGVAAATIFKTNLPAQHNWVVYSKKLGQSNGVTNYWCDDEWDIQRSRGMKPTARSVGVVP